MSTLLASNRIAWGRWSSNINPWFFSPPFFPLVHCCSETPSPWQHITTNQECAHATRSYVMSLPARKVVSTKQKVTRHVSCWPLYPKCFVTIQHRVAAIFFNLWFWLEIQEKKNPIDWWDVSGQSHCRGFSPQTILYVVSEVNFSCTLLSSKCVSTCAVQVFSHSEWTLRNHCATARFASGVTPGLRCKPWGIKHISLLLCALFKQLRGCCFFFFFLITMCRMVELGLRLKNTRQ